MNDKILTQIMDHLRTTPLNPSEVFELALQSLAWAKLSGQGGIAESLRLTPALLGDPSRARAALLQLGQDDTPWRAAFTNGKPLERLTPPMISPVLELAMSFSAKGFLNAYDPADAITQQDRTVGESALPPEVADLIAGLVGIQAGESAYTPWDTGAQLAIRAARSGAAVYLETPIQSAIPALIGILADQSFQIAHAEPIRNPSAIENAKLRQFDVALAVPPFGLRYDPAAIERSDLFNRFPERTPSGAVLSIRHLLAQTRRRAVIAVTNNVLFSGGGDLTLRQDLLNRGIVEAIIALPSGLLDTTNIPFAVLILDPAGGHQQVRFIDADSPKFREQKSKAKAQLINLELLIQQSLESNPSENVAIVPVADILANEAQLQVSRYVLPNTTKQLQARLATAKTIALSDLVTTIRPLPPVAEGTEGIDAFEIGAADLPDHGYIRTPGRTIRVSSRSDQQFLKPHDIVLIVKGSVGKLGIVPQDVPASGAGGWVAGQSAIVLRGSHGARIDPLTLALQLRAPLGKELLAGIVSGATIKLIQLKELNRLHVLIPDPETIQRAADAFAMEVSLQAEIDRLREQQEHACAALWTLD